MIISTGLIIICGPKGPQCPLYKWFIHNILLDVVISSITCCSKTQQQQQQQ